MTPLSYAALALKQMAARIVTAAKESERKAEQCQHRSNEDYYIYEAMGLRVAAGMCREEARKIEKDGRGK